MFKNMSKKSMHRRLLMSFFIMCFYILLTELLRGVSFGPVQLRISEFLLVIPFFCPFCTIGLMIGCFISNFFLSPYGMVDAVCGSLSTLACCIIILLLGMFKEKNLKVHVNVCFIPPVIKGIVIGGMIAYSIVGQLFTSE